MVGGDGRAAGWGSVQGGRERGGGRVGSSNLNGRDVVLNINRSARVPKENATNWLARHAFVNTISEQTSL